MPSTEQRMDDLRPVMDAAASERAAQLAYPEARRSRLRLRSARRDAGVRRSPFTSLRRAASLALDGKIIRF
jgi:hypothetical protein